MSSTIAPSESAPQVRRRYTKAEDRQRLLQAFSQSGLTPHEFALRHDITISTLQRWQGRARTGSEALTSLAAPSMFIEADAAPMAPMCLGCGLRLELTAHQAVLTITNRASVLWAVELLRALSPRC